MDKEMVNIAMKMTHVFKGDARMAGHSLKVYGYAMMIADGEGLHEYPLRTLGMAALLHDVGIPISLEKYGSAAGPYQEREGQPIAQGILTQLGVAPERVARVCRLIGIHHTYGLNEGMDYHILLDADLIVNAEEGSLNGEAARGRMVTATGRDLLDLLIP